LWLLSLLFPSSILTLRMTLVAPRDTRVWKSNDRIKYHSLWGYVR
jgi:hypothetical protein